MIGIFYNKQILGDILLININDNQAINLKKDQGFVIGYDDKNQVCFINIFDASKKIFNLVNGLNPLTKSLINQIKELTAIDLASFDLSNKFTVAKIEQCDPIEGTHLHKCLVDVGKEKKLQIICGAKNARVGIKVVCAQIDAILPNGIRIKPSKLMGIESFGMLCSAKELNLLHLKKFNDLGIIELDDSYQIGNEFNEIYSSN